MELHRFHSDRDGNSDTDGKTDSNSDFEADANTDSEADANTDSEADANTDALRRSFRSDRHNDRYIYRKQGQGARTVHRTD